MPSKTFNSYSPGKKREVIAKLLNVQSNICLFCDEKIIYEPSMDLAEFLSQHNVDHINPSTEHEVFYL